MNKKIAIALSVIILGVAAVLYAYQPKQVAVEDPNQAPQITSTNPEPLENATVLPNQPLEITFNRPLENTAEFRTSIEPKIEYKVELSDDHKTAKFTFINPLDLGSGYTLIIQRGSKFEGKRELENDYIFHFKTIEYRGV